MAFHDPDRFITRNHTSSYPLLESLFEGRSSEASTHGPKGRIFDLPAGLQVTALDAHHLQVGEHVLRTDVFALPSAPLIAVVAASPLFRQYEGLDALLQALHDPDTGVDAFRRQLSAVVAGGLRSEQPAQLVNPSSGFLASWRPDQTRFIRTDEGHWFTALGCELNPSADLLSAPVRTTFGVDLGSSPVVCAAGGDRRVLGFGGQHFPLLDDLRRRRDYEEAERWVLRMLTYAVGRAEAEAAIRYLAEHGRTVYAEALTLEGMWGGFVANGRLQATFDFHFAWLPQGLYRAGVPFKRVSARGTSRLCHLHIHTIGKRLGRQFFCPECDGQQHADTNAAFNILDRGLARFGVLPMRRVRSLRRAGQEAKRRSGTYQSE
ncbi:zinc ribbon domain-containing protein [Deinococcus arcticus]|uniref:Cas12f1-like TNB domain-containing protein n=1 Tax=Deinococcus arcticus TaxID=2136176 RepID=A0A2T3W4W9_9DEIO|nr:zinc ribbon domain-containing protein [Deinococcus arcticus]PTA66945.1 hypothetical protein C8263_15370 [Deinococcus arcticus]